MDVWYYRIVWHVTLWNNTKALWGQFEFVLPSHTLAWFTPLDLPGRCGGCMHQQSTSDRKKKKKKKTLHMLTHGAMRGCGLTSYMVCINDKFCDTRERNVTMRSEIWTTNIRSLGVQGIRECMPLWRLIVWSLASNGLLLFLDAILPNVVNMRGIKSCDGVNTHQAYMN